MGPVDVVEKFIIHLTKVLMSVLENHPFSYIDLIRPSLELAFFYIFTVEGEPLLFERFTIQCLNIVKGILLCAEYKPAKVEEGKQLTNLGLTSIFFFDLVYCWHLTPIIIDIKIRKMKDP